ncbi:MAG: PQQ-like beta-propeller repeat protein [Acidobacteria bacterium]|nr:PQQ-like beta-propeller repeat protein [Acidobacteriota bacterium]
MAFMHSVGRVAGAVVVLAVGATGPSGAQRPANDWTQWRGPNRDGAIAGFTAPASWPERLTQRWTIDAGLGYATPLVVGDRVYLFSRLGENETMRALDAASGKVLWRTGYPAPFTMNSAAARHGPGPKSTPVFANGRLYSIGMTGIVTAFDAASGKQVWQRPGSANVPMYTSHAFSPVVEGNLVVFHVGGHDMGALTAFDVNTGDARWSWTGDGPGYGSPIVATIGGTRQLVAITQGKLVGIDVSTGAPLWERPFVSSNFTNSITPVLYGQTIIAWGHSGPMTAVRPVRQNTRWVVETAWENPDLPGRMSNGVIVGDMLVGLTSRNMGQYFALDPTTGKTLWTSDPRQAAQAAMQTAGDLVFSLEEDGELVISRVTRTASSPVRRYKLADTETWTQPVISGNRVFVKDVSSLALWTLN